MLLQKKGFIVPALSMVVSLYVSLALAGEPQSEELLAKGKLRSAAIAKQFPQKMRMIIGGPCHYWGIDPIVQQDLRNAGMEVLSWPEAPTLNYASRVIQGDIHRYNIIVFGDVHYHLIQPDPNTGEIPDRIKSQIPKLKRFLEAGGGIWFCGLGEQNWGRSSHALNYILKELGLGAEVVGEVIKDTQAIKIDKHHFSHYAWTEVLPDPITKGVKNMLTPSGVISGEGSMGVVPITKVTSDWRVLIKGKSTAASYPCVEGDAGGSLQAKPKTVKSSPIICAVRQAGKGRVVLWPTWSNFTVTGGSGGSLFDATHEGKQSDGARLIENLLCWLAEPGQNNDAVGTLDLNQAPVTRKLKDIDADLKSWKSPGRRGYAAHYKGLIGAHSNISDGTSSPEEMIAAAKEEGYNFIAFTEDFAKMDEAKWKKLVAICDNVETSGGGTLICGRGRNCESQMKFSQPVSVEFSGVYLKKLGRSSNNQLGFAPFGHGPDMVVWTVDGSTDNKQLVPLRHVNGKDFWRDGYKHAVVLNSLPDIAKEENAIDLRIDWWPGKKVSYYLNNKLIATFTESVPNVAVPVGIRDETVGWRIGAVKVTSLQQKGKVLFVDDFSASAKLDTAKKWRLPEDGKAPTIRRDANFLAYPGLDFIDEAGNRGLVFGHRYWIKDEWRSKKDPSRIRWWYNLSYQADAEPHRWFPRVIIRSKTNPKRPWYQGLWSFFGAYCYEGGKLVDDSFKEWQRLIRRHVFFMNTGIMAIHTVRNVDEIRASSAPGLYQTYVGAANLSSVLARLRGCTGSSEGATFRSFISAGPEILNISLHTAVLGGEYSFDLGHPDNDRGLLHMAVRARQGLAEVSLYDGERLVRRFRPEGKLFEKYITIHPESYHAYMLTATDKLGQRAVSWTSFIQIQERVYRRCGDNWNWMTTGKGAGMIGTPKLGYGLLEVSHGWTPRTLEPVTKVARRRYWCEQGSPGHGGLSGAINGYIRPFGLLVDGEPWPTMRYPISALTLDFDTIGRFGTVVTTTARHELMIEDKLEPYTIGAFSGPYKVRKSPWPANLKQWIPMGKPGGMSVTRYQGKVEFTKNIGSNVRLGLGATGDPTATTIEIMQADGTVTYRKGSKKNITGDVPENGYICWYDEKGDGVGGVIALSSGVKYAYNTGWQSCSVNLPAPIKPGTKAGWDVLYVTGTRDTVNSNEQMIKIWRGMGIAGKPTLYKVEPQVGKVLDQKFFLTLESEDYGFSGKIIKTPGKQLPVHLTVLVKGLNPRWDAALWYKGDTQLLYVNYFHDKWGLESWMWRMAEYIPRTNELRYIPILRNKAGYCQVETDKQDPEIFIGNPIVCDQAEVFICVIKAEKDKCTFEINNPTDKTLSVTVRPSKGFELTGRWERVLTLPAGSMKTVTASGGGG